MRYWSLVFAVIAAVSAVPFSPTLPTKTKDCIDGCTCRSSKLPSRLPVVDCVGPVVLNATTFTYVNRKSINVISFENVTITQIQEDAFKGFENLDDVLILNSRIGSIDTKAFNDVRRVKFADCGFEDRPDLVSEKLEELHFGSCRLDEIPKLNGLFSLTFLNLSGNYIKNIEIDTFAELYDLEVLYLSDNEIFKLPPTLFINNAELNSLYLDDNHLKHFYLNTSENLETLSLKNCQLEIFDEESVARLSALNDLNLSHNKLKILSKKTFALMKDLAVLNLSYNQLTKLDDDIFSENSRLIKITLDGNQFETLPNFYINGGVEMENFATYTFSCKHCGLKTLSSSVFQYMAGIISLDLSHNKFMNVDNVFQKISSLKLLDISYNNIAYFSPATFLNNTNLEILNIAGNPLMTLNPEVFANNLILREIDARNASITKLWSNTNQSLRSLRRLLLSDNLLRTLHIQDFTILPSLEAIDLNNNPLLFNDQFCQVINWLDMKRVLPIESTKMLNTGFEKTFGDDIDGFTTIEWKEFHNKQCPDVIIQTTTAIPVVIENEDINELIDSDYDDDYNYDDDEMPLTKEAENVDSLKKYIEDENGSLARASYILSVTSAFVLSALVVLTVAVTVTLCILRRNSNFNMHRANLPRLKIPLWNTTPGQKKHSGSVYRPLSEDLTGPKTPKLSRYEFTTTPIVHSS